MVQSVILSKRDFSLLGLLEMTPATAAQIRKASVTFDEEPFRDERRVRERMQALGDAGLVRSWPAAIGGGGLMHYYKLTPEGFKSLHPERGDSPVRSVVSEIAPSRLQHAMATAEVIVHTIVACHSARVRILKYHGDEKTDACGRGVPPTAIVAAVRAGGSRLICCRALPRSPYSARRGYHAASLLPPPRNQERSLWA